MNLRIHAWKALLCLGAVILQTQVSGAYSILTHEQVVDLLWVDRIQPMLKARFPDVTDEQLKQAHAYAYGGSLVQDMGYYPFGNKYFSDLTHYVRTGDFVTALITESATANEYAFALGALAHYAADNAGHPMVNQVVAMEFPRLRKKFGNVVTYEDSPQAHIRAEFGFDMTQVAKNRYTSDRYHDFIGFEISQGLLERVFPKVYGIDFKDVVKNEDLAIGTFRHAVSSVIPEMTRVALLARKKEIVADTPNAAKRKYLYYLSRADYEKEWGTKYRRPGFGTRLLAMVLKLFPKVGPFRGLSFKVPTPQAEDMFVRSIDGTVESYRQLLQSAQAGTLHLDNKDFDTGQEARPGEYGLTDTTYARLVDGLASSDFKQMTPDLRENILAFYTNPQARHPRQHDKRKKTDWTKLQNQLKMLRTKTPSASAAPERSEGTGNSAQ